MCDFIKDDFLLKNQTAKKCYEVARDMPIFDYHCHLSAKEIFEDRTFFNMTELWLEGDHYKWRMMRQFGVPENLITGGGIAYDKFFAFCSCLPHFIGNPVYDWTHLELKKYFGIIEPLSEYTAVEVWNKTQAIMKNGDFSARKLIEKSNVHTLITTDDPMDDLKYHSLLQKEKISFNVLPCFRVDRIINIEKSDFESYVKELSKVTNTCILGLADFLLAVQLRLDFFVKMGAVSTDCSIANFVKAKGDLRVADRAFKKRMKGQTIDEQEENEYKFCVLCGLAQLFKQHNLVMQLHIGALRNVNSLMYEKLGVDSGVDSIGEAVDIKSAANFLNNVETSVGLPKTVCYTHNPNSYYPLATMLGNFAGGELGKTQLGAAWWMMDNMDGILEQLKVFANTGGLGYFNGMLTDSRSFTAFVRHDYFRRILSSFIGEIVEGGRYPCNFSSLEKLVQNICFFNAKNFFSK